MSGTVGHPAPRRSLLDGTPTPGVASLLELDLMAEQLDRLVEASTRPNVRLGVITHRTPASFTAGHGFHIYDRQAVQIGTRTATALTSDQRDVEAYESLFAELERVAAFGDEARSVFQELGDRYRAMSGR
jgi:Domain of unknown function (DUF5753)